MTRRFPAAPFLAAALALSPAAGLAQQSGQAGAAPQAAQVQNLALKREGRWILGVRKLPNGAAGCFAGTTNGAQQFFEYVWWNIEIGMFRFASPDIRARKNDSDMWLLTKVDGEPAGKLQARIIQGAATMPVRHEDENRRAFVKRLAEGAKLELFDSEEAKLAEFDLTGARSVFFGFGRCRTRLPAPPAGMIQR